MNLLGTEYNFDRIMRVSFYETKNAFNQGDSSRLVFEYAPLDDKASSFARIDTTITYRPTTVSATGKKGFTAKIRLYNVDESTLHLISKINVSTTSKHVFVRVEAGYWNHEGSIKEDGIDSRRNYHTVYTGFVNTTSYFREGTDTILDIYCFQIELSTTSLTRVAVENQALNAVLAEEKSAGVAAMDRVFTQRNNEASTFNSKNFSARAELIAQKLLPFKWPQDKTQSALADLGLPIDSKNADKTYIPEDVTSADRNKNDWFVIHYIEENPGAGDPAVVGYTESIAFKNKLNELTDATKAITLNLSPTEENFATKMTELTNSVGARWKKSDIPSKDGEVQIFVFPPADQKGSSFAATSKGAREYNVKPGETIHIKNFQNFLVAPVIDGRGCFTLKMLFNPDMEPRKYVQLDWDGNTEGAQISSLTKGVNANGSMAAYYPMLQWGEESAILLKAGKGSAQTRGGSVFNRPFFIMFVTHDLSTHTGKWTTEVRTSPGGYIETVEKEELK